MNKETYCVDNDISEAVLSVLRYYSLFSYPLKADEVYTNLSVACSFAMVLVTLEDMKELEKVYYSDGYYSIDEQVEEQVARRKKANKLATIQKKKAIRVGRFLYKFPFVKFVGISGSLSKGYADEKSDFDFFIVTAGNRLWICRTALHLFKKFTFLAGQQHKFCMNYFIDTNSMEIEEQNLFTATELSTLIPVAGLNVYNDMIHKNLWVNNYLPNRHINPYSTTNRIVSKISILKTCLELAFNKAFPEKTNILLMKLTDSKWKKKWAKKNYPADEYNIAFKTTVHISKNHPANHQKRVLRALSKIEDKNQPL